jgi:hypothetical protein
MNIVTRFGNIFSVKGGKYESDKITNNIYSSYGCCIALRSVVNNGHQVEQ